MLAIDSTSDYAGGWLARLHLELEHSGIRTTVKRAIHHGPLRVQRAFYPESDGTCHLLILHPPGGVVGGDVLDLCLEVHESGSCLVTTPGATKLYRCDGRSSRISTAIHVASGSRCEWLPQEMIVFNGARTRVRTEVHLDDGASFIGWEVNPSCLRI